MADKSPIDLLSDLNQQLAQENQDLKSRLKPSHGDGTFDGMDLTTYRLDQFEKRADAADARMARVEDKLTNIQVTLAGLATKDGMRNWGLALVAIVIATGIGVGAVMLQSAGNQLSAFQAGLSSVQAVVTASQAGPHEAAPPTSAPTNQKR